jgi:hypothetical protein
MFKIPNTNKKFSQTNESDKDGNIYITKNINFDEKGYIKLSERTRVIADESSMANIIDSSSTTVSVLVFAENQGAFWALANEAPYTSSTILYTDGILTWTKETTSGVPAMNADGDIDMVQWNNKLYVSNGSEIYTYSAAGPTWTDLNASNAGEVLAVFHELNYVAYADDNYVSLLNTSDALANQLILPSNYKVISMASNGSRMYIGTSSYSSGSDGKAVLFEWDGLGSGFNISHKTEAKEIYCVVPYKEGVAFLDSTGTLWYCRGGLTKLANFPDLLTKRDLTMGNTTNPYRPVNRRGMVVDGDKIYIAFTSILSNPEDGLSWKNTLPSGVWCYDPEVGLYHRYSIGSSIQDLSNAIPTTDVNTTTNVITVAGVTVPVTGTPLFYFNHGSTSITGLSVGKRYFTIKLTDTTLKVAETYADAIAGTAIDLTGTGNNSQFITFHPNSDFGGINNIYGGLYLNRNSRIDYGLSTATNSGLFIGGLVQSGTDSTWGTTTISTTQAKQENRGYFITPKFESENITDVFNKVVTKWSRALNPDDKIVIKYRTTDNNLQDYRKYTVESITWTDSNTFTTTMDLSDVAVGDEVEIVAGMGAGYLAHITAISENSGTYTVDIDETIQNISANDKATAVFGNWKKLIEIDATSSINYKDIALNVEGTWLQLKVELRGIDVKIEELSVINSKHKEMV